MGMLLGPINEVYDTSVERHGRVASVGTFYYPIRVGRLDGSAFETIEALVDTGSTWTWIPRPILDRLGIPVADRRELQMANGQIVERESGWVLITADGITVPSIGIFGDPESIPLLGAVTLEECSLAPDPLRQRLVRIVGLALASTRR